MIDGQELHQIVRQLRIELEWATRTGIEVIAPKAEPVDVTEVLKASRAQPKARPRQQQRSEPPPQGGPRPDRRPEPPPPGHNRPPAAQDQPRHEQRSGRPPRREGAPKNRPWEAYAAPAADAAEQKQLQQTLTEATSLSVVQEALGDCKRCKLSSGRRNIVFGVGNEQADLMFVGEGPGAEEDRRGEPFVGKAGQLLTKIIEGGMGMSRADVYIANIVKCRPPNNRDPEPDEVEACEKFLAAQIDVVKPKVIVALGRYAAQTLLRDRTPITRMRGRWSEYRGIAVMPTYHPAYLLRNPAEKRPVWEDVQEVMSRLGATESEG